MVESDVWIVFPGAMALRVLVREENPLSLLAHFQGSVWILQELTNQSQSVLQTRSLLVVVLIPRRKRVVVQNLRRTLSQNISWIRIRMAVSIRRNYDDGIRNAIWTCQVIVEVPWTGDCDAETDELYREVYNMPL